MNEKQILMRLEKLEKAVFGDQAEKVLKKDDGGGIKFDFSVNIRAYAKKHLSELSGPKKFTLLLAYLTKGEIGKDVPIEEIIRTWNKMKAKNMLGKYNASYSDKAKVRGLVNSTKHGQYHLLKNWKEAA